MDRRGKTALAAVMASIASLSLHLELLGVALGTSLLRFLAHVAASARPKTPRVDSGGAA